MIADAAAPAPTPPTTLKVGGTLNPERHVYIERVEDKELLRLLLAGEFVNVVAPRQMGKSSLVMRTRKVLRERGWQAAMVDLTELGTPGDATAYFIGILRSLARELKLGIDVAEWWKDAEKGGTASQRLQAFFRDVVIPIVDQRLVIFIDEIDSSLKLPFADDLFTSIRWLFNERAKSLQFEKLIFCLIGVAAPNELIKDRRTTPYNIGHSLALKDFDAARDDLQEFLGRLNGRRDVLDRIMYWSDGQPYLVVLLTNVMEKSGDPSPAAIDAYVEERFAVLDSLRDDIHFTAVLQFIELRLQRSLENLSTYARVLKGERIKARPTPSHLELQLSGLVKRDEAGCLIIPNRIYGRLFDRKWLDTILPHETEKVVRPYRRRVVLATVVAVVGLVLGATTISWYQVQKAEVAQVAQQQRDLRSKGIELSRDADNKYFLSIYNNAPDDVLKALAEAGVDPLSVTRLEAKEIQKSVMDLRWMSALRNLEEADLSSSPITDITPLQSLTKLRVLRLSDTNIEDVRPLRGLVNLDLLHLQRTKVRDIEPLRGLVNLRQLWLSGSQVVDIKALRNLPQLDTLSASYTPLADFETVKELKGLDFISLSGTSVPDLNLVANLPKLTMLYVSSTRVSDLWRAKISGYQ
jgi:Leucine-rich repeat (LRR) protein